MQNVEYIYGLSPAQEGMLYHTLLTPDTRPYFEQGVFTIRGKIQRQHFEKAWQRAVNQHAGLRTSFFWKDLERPVQVVQKSVELPIQWLDWTHYSAAEKDALWQQLLKDDREQGFQLSNAPLMRLTVLQLEETLFRAVLSFHHLLLDAWALQLVLRGIIFDYLALCEGREISLEPSRPYRDYISWLQQQDLDKAEAFWRGQLKGFALATSLGSNVPLRTSPSDQEYLTCGACINPQLGVRLRTLAAKNGLTLNSVMQGAWAVLLSRYTGQDDVVFGTTVSGRPAELKDVENIVGCFINTLPLRITMPGGDSLIPWFKYVQEQQREAIKYEYSPLAQVQKWSEIEPGSPLFDHLLVFEGIPEVGTKSGEQKEEFEFHFELVERTGYPLTVTIQPGNEEVSIRLTYSQNRFDDAKAQRLLAHYEQILTEIADDAAQPIAQLSLLSDQERRQVLVEWNQTHVEYARERCFHELIEDQVARTPQAFAFAAGDRQLRYTELNRRANQLANYLRKLGVGPEVPVGICIERGLEMMVSLLGILKAGGAYLPLDPTYPEERLTYMLEDSKAPVLLTQQALLPRFSAYAGRVVTIDEQWVDIAKGDSGNPEKAVASNNVAYVIYTSGSTGRPKGVSIQHCNVVNFFKGIDQTIACGPEDTLLAVTSIAFDISILELFWPLTRGAKVALASPSHHSGLNASVGGPSQVVEKSLAELAIERTPTLMQCTPSTMRLLMADQDLFTALRSLNLLMLGGEALPASLAAEIKEALPCRLINMYGPTETTIWSSTDEIADANSPISIGRPIANTELYVLDASQIRPVGVGLIGELYIGGEGVARGYLGRPELTAERFIPDPFSGRHGSRLYKTGDVARYLSCGKVEILGRVDQQVKIRGYRIELGEIEGVLQKEGNLEHAVVVAREEPSGEKKLVAYLVEREPVNTNELRDKIKQLLPEYMVPSVFVVMDELPLTPNGKIDRRALPAPTSEHTIRHHRYVAPRTPVEEIMAGIWEDVLRVPQVSLEDNFFELGGHSLLATQVTSRVKASFGVELPLQQVFESPTVKQLAADVEEALFSNNGQVPEKAGQARGTSRISALQDGEGHESDSLLSLDQQSLWVLDQLEFGSAVYNSSFGLRLKGELHKGALQQSVNHLVQRHEALRATFPSSDGTPVLNVAANQKLQIKEIDLRSAPEADRETEARKVAIAEVAQPFDLARGPLLRVTLLQLGDHEHVLLVHHHQIVADEWSQQLMMQELATVYDACCEAKASPLAPLQFQYGDFVAAQAVCLKADPLERGLQYWKNQLAGLAPLEMPADFARPAVASRRGGSVKVNLDEDLAERVRQFSQEQGVTSFMTLLAVFHVLLARYSGQEDFAVGTEVANRDLPGAGETIGLFAKPLALRTNLVGDPTFAEAVARVRRTVFEAYEHHDLPFEKLVQELEPIPDLGRQPLFQATLIMHHAAISESKIGSLMVEPFAEATGCILHDLELHVTETRQGLSAVLKYACDLFAGQRIERMAGHYTQLLEAAISVPQARLSELPLVTEGEWQFVAQYLADGDNEHPEQTDQRAKASKQRIEPVAPSPLGAEIDRERSSVPSPETAQHEQTYMAPRTWVEKVVAEIWKDVLKRDQVSVRDNFFGLAANSLAATRVMSRVRRSFDVDLPLRTLFEAPSVAGLSTRIEQAIQLRPPLHATSIPRADRSRDLPLSHSQQRLWFIDQLEMGTTAYNMPFGVRLKGPLDKAALQHTFSEIVRRHEVLRTCFPQRNGTAVQEILAPAPVQIEEVDLRSLSPGDRETNATEIAFKEANRSFDLARGPLLRVKLLQLEDQEHVLLPTMHHIVSDGWSLEIMMREFTALYEAYLKGQPSPLPELDIQYADYAVWQREWLQGKLSQDQLSYWRTQLDHLPVLELPTDYPRPAHPSGRCGNVFFDLGADLTSKVKRFSLEHRVTVFMTMLTALKVLLARYSGQDDIAVGTDVANRHRLEIEPLVGFFVNEVVLRTRLNGDPSFLQALDRVKQVMLEAFRHQDLPLDKLVEELKPERYLSRNPLYQVIMIFQNPVRQKPTAGGLKVERFEAEVEKVRLDLELVATDTPGGLRAVLHYAQDLFTAETAERMVDHYKRLLRVAVTSPAEKIFHVPLLTEEEKHWVLLDRNRTAAEFPQECVHELFEEQVLRTPDAIAVEHDGCSLTYRDLDREASLVAQRLKKLGVGPEVRVGICLDRSLRMVIGLLGILKAGGVYVPLDPAYPAERLTYMMEDAGISVLLTEHRSKQSVQAYTGTVLYLDQDYGEIPTAWETSARATPANLAYVIYTSGSTGKPKGVGISHAAVVNFLSAMRWEPGIAAKDKLLAVTPLSFDIAGLEIYLPLTVGASVSIVSREDAVDGRRLMGKMKDITIMQATPATWQALIEAGWSGDTRLKVLCGGEALPEGLAKKLAERSGALWNMYGPTETTIWSLTQSIENNAGEVSIGHPIANTEIFVLDKEMNPVPVGVLGGLYIGGIGLARGYWGRSELTAEKFVPHPFSARDGERLYYTGDIVRWQTDGKLRFVGRADHQVKIRGYRIELQEVEAALLKSPEIEQAAVAVQEDGFSQKRLVAYIVLRDQNGALDRQSLRAGLQQSVPDYMIPNTFVPLGQMPLTIGGKIDRKSLPPVSAASQGEIYVPPSTGVEETIAAIWAEVLKLPQVGITQNFFDLGGHSLLATQVALRIREAFGIDLPLRRLFESQTVERLALTVEDILLSEIERIPEEEAARLAHSSSAIS